MSNHIRIEKLGFDELEDIVELYRAAVGAPGCVWDEQYPSEEDIRTDIEQGALYGVHDEKGHVIAAIAQDHDENTDLLPCWSAELQPGAEFARVVVAGEYRGRGIAAEMIRNYMRILRNQGYNSVRYLVAEQNLAARRAYEPLGFQKVGEVDIYGAHYLCYEKALTLCSEI